MAYAPLKLSNKRHIEKNDRIITATDPTFASENRRRKTEGSLALCSSAVPPESIVGEAWCQPCAINHPLSEEGRQGGDPPLRTGGWKFSCPPRLLKARAATDRTPTAGLAIRGRPRPEGPRTAATAASPLPPSHPSSTVK